MNEETIKNIIEKYKAGASSLEEEKRLLQSAKKMEHPLKKWFDFVKLNQNKIPENFKDTLWESFEAKTKKTQKLKVGLWSVAASITLILSLFVYNMNSNELSESEKSALLEEAKSMFEDEKKEQMIYNKILENDLIIVYTKIN
ncbi:hypothetical protein [Polaribacter sp.]|uniref:hypothetical protein n=1 Tax=Polaribacter sp. TaxID=1920175 RepID=UPI003F6C0C60